MKSKLFILLFFTFLVSVIGAQIAHEPNSDLYKDIDRWAVQGYIRAFLPVIRPYPLPLIDQIIEEVIENGDDAAQELALKYKSDLGIGSSFINPGITGFLQGKKDNMELLGIIYAEGPFRITPMLTGSYNLSFLVLTGDDEKMANVNIPGKYSPVPDVIFDNANLGSFEFQQNWTSMLSFGNSSTYLQAGLARTSFGPFYDNGLVVGPQTPRAGHLSFVFWQPKWSFEMLYQIITAADDFGEGMHPAKYNVIHSINIRPIEKVEVGFIQSVVYGQRFEPMYLIPFSYLFGSQSIFGFDDNVFMGFHGRWRPFDSFLVKGLIYIDDFHLNKMISEGQFLAKGAGQLGISWTPKFPYFSKLDFDYTAVLPYAYTHWTEPRDKRYNREGIPNYLNYTHLGKNIGPDLEPNSDRISLRTWWTVSRFVELSLSGYMKRHGNSSQKFIDRGIIKGDDIKNHDGSINDDGLYLREGEEDKTNTSHLGYGFDYWLKDILDTRLGGIIGLTIDFPPSEFGTTRLILEYCAEYGWNKGLIKGNNSLEHYWSIGGMWRW